MDEALEVFQLSASIVSTVPGRVRIRVVAGPSAAGDLDRLVRALDVLDEVVEVEARPHARSVVAHFAPRDAATVTARLEALGVGPSGGARSGRDPATVVVEAAGAVNGSLVRRVRHGDLRTLVPLGLGLLSVRQALRGSDRLTDAPWYILAWYASETFFKFHGDPGTRGPAEQAKEQ